MSEEVYTYVGFDKDGRARAFVRDDPAYQGDTARMVAEWIADGRTVQRMPWAEMHAAMSAK